MPTIAAALARLVLQLPSLLRCRLQAPVQRCRFSCGFGDNLQKSASIGHIFVRCTIVDWVLTEQFLPPHFILKDVSMFQRIEKLTNVEPSFSAMIAGSALIAAAAFFKGHVVIGMISTACSLYVVHFICTTKLKLALRNTVR